MNKLMLSTTFRIMKHNSCNKKYKHIGKALGGIRKYGRNTPITLLQIFDICGLGYTLWALRYMFPYQEQKRDKIARLFACDCAEDVLHIFEQEYPDDKRPHNAIETARKYAVGEATDEELLKIRWKALAANEQAKTKATQQAATAAWAAACDLSLTSVMINVIIQYMPKDRQPEILRKCLVKNNY